MKKIISLMLCLIMLASFVPSLALAAGTLCPACGAAELEHCDATPATCKATGCSEHWKCPSCEKLFRNETDTDPVEISEITIAIDPDAHSYGDFQYDTGNPGKHKRECSLCGNVDTQNCQNGAPICVDDNQHKFVCAVCNHETLEDHSKTAYGRDNSSHWPRCTICDWNSKNSEPHTYTDRACTTCGYHMYIISEEAGRTVDKTNPEALTFTSDAPFEKFICVFINNSILDAAKYDKAEGSTKITLHADYLKDLAEGTYTIEVKSTDGSAFSRFIVGTPGPLVLTEIEITTPPTKTAYKEGESFDGTGMVVTAKYSDGSSRPVTAYTVSPMTLGRTDTAVTVTYTEDGTTKTATLPVTVTPVYKVTFQMNGHGAQVAALDVVSGEKLTAPAQPTETNWVFRGWFTSNALQNVYDFNTPVTSDMTLFAKWNPVSKATARVSNGNYAYINGTASATVEKGQSVTFEGKIKTEGYYIGRVTLDGVIVWSGNEQICDYTYVCNDTTPNLNHEIVFQVFDKKGAPATGDTENMLTWITILAISGTCAAACTILYRKKLKGKN